MAALEEHLGKPHADRDRSRENRETRWSPRRARRPSASPNAAATTRPWSEANVPGSNGASTTGASRSASHASPSAWWGHAPNAIASVTPAARAHAARSHPTVRIAATRTSPRPPLRRRTARTTPALRASPRTRPRARRPGSRRWTPGSRIAQPTALTRRPRSASTSGVPWWRTASATPAAARRSKTADGPAARRPARTSARRWRRARWNGRRRSGRRARQRPPRGALSRRGARGRSRAARAWRRGRAAALRLQARPLRERRAPRASRGQCSARRGLPAAEPR